MRKPLSEEQELLNDLKKQERWWRIFRFILLVAGIWAIFFPIKSAPDNSFIGAMFISWALGRWHGDPKSKLLIKLYEEKLEKEFIEEEIEKARQNVAQEKR